MSAGAVPTPKSGLFQLDKTLLDKAASAVAVEISAGSAELLTALTADAPFPAGDIDMFRGGSRAEASRDIVFNSGGGKVKFAGEGGAQAGMALLSDPTARLKKLGFGTALEQGLSIKPLEGSRYLLLGWGYDVSGSADGSVALGAAGAVTFGAGAARQAAHVVVRRVPDAAKARTTLAETVASWRMPAQVRTQQDLLPGSWALTEVDGSVALSLGAQLGYDYSWVRDFQVGGLKGDIGLRVALNASVAVGFQASGEYALVLHRGEGDHENVVSLKLFRLNRRTVSVSAQAGATVTPSATLPAQADDFIAAVFGVHGQQILRDLKTIEAWTDPSAPLGEMISELGVDYGFELLTALTGIDAEQKLTLAQSRLSDVLRKWEDLPSEVSATVWRQLDELTGAASAAERKQIEAKIGELRDYVHSIATLDDDGIRGAIAGPLRDVAFFQSPVGQWLQAVAGDSVLTLMERQSELRTAATRTAAVLDKAANGEGAVEDVIRKLQGLIAERLKLDRIEKLAANISQQDFDAIDKWLKLKLASFLDEKLSQLNLEKVQQVAGAIHTMLGKRQELYAAAVRALNKSYQFSFKAAYERTSEKTALLDIEFDLSGNPSAAQSLLRAAIGGDFNRVLTESVKGVSLRAGRLTHGIRRQTSVDVSLPYFDRSKVHVTEALASVEAVEDEGRVLLYDVKASDRVAVAGRRSSELAIAANIPVRAAGGVTVWNPHKGFVGYTFQHIKKKLKREELEFELEPLTASYFPEAFGTAEDQKTLSEWITGLDRYIDEIEHNGDDQFGNTILDLELSYPISVLRGWGLAPREEKSPEYREMYRRIQRSLRQVIPFFWFNEPERYLPLAVAAPLLVYKHLPVSTQIKLAGATLTTNSGDAVFWDYRDPRKLAAMANSSEALLALEREVAAIQRRARQRGLERVAAEYGLMSAGRLTGFALADGARALVSLLSVEEDIARAAIKAGQKMAKFREKAANEPTEAIDRLAGFGMKLTQAFNAKVRSVYETVPLAPIGPMMLIEASRAFRSAAEGVAVAPAAMLTLSVYKQAVRFPPKTLPPPADDLVLTERLFAQGGELLGR